MKTFLSFFFLGVGVRDYGSRESETTNEELHSTIPSKLLQVKRPFTKEYLALILNQQRSHLILDSKFDITPPRKLAKNVKETVLCEGRMNILESLRPTLRLVYYFNSLSN